MLDLLDSRILIDIISPSGESFTEVRERTFTSRISEIDNSYSEPMEIRTNFPFYEDSGEYVVEAFLVSNRDASTLPAVDVPKGEVLASTTFKILDNQPRTGEIVIGDFTMFRLESPLFADRVQLPSPTDATTTNFQHVLSFEITNNQNGEVGNAELTSTVKTPDDPIGSKFITSIPPFAGTASQFSVGFIPTTPGDYLFEFEIVDIETREILVPLFTHTVVVTGETTNPEMTPQELTDEIIELKKIIAELLQRLADAGIP